MAIEIIAKAKNGKANFNDVSELSAQLGNALSRLIAANVTPDKLPNGKLYYNIANTFLTGSLRDNYDLINLTAQAVQESIDNRNGIMIEPQKAEFPADRVHAIVNAVSDETADWSTIERRLDSPVRNVTESFYNDYVEANAEFRSDAGFKPYIIRETDGNCCAWCSSLAGQYEYPNDVPPDVYARHDNCTCTVTYVTDKYRQDVWSKKSYALTPEERKNVLENTPKPERFTRQQAKDVEKSNLKGAVGVANSGESGIIKLTEDEASALNSYISSESYKINEKLRSGTKLTAEEEKFVDNLDSALSKMPKYEGTVYRSMMSDMIPDIQEFRRLHQPGSYVHCSAYTSSSLEIYDGTMDIQFVIQSKNGKNITGFNPGEKEIIFERNSLFYVSKIQGNVIYLEEC